MPPIRLCREALLYAPPDADPLLLVDRNAEIEATNVSPELAALLARLGVSRELSEVAAELGTAPAELTALLDAWARSHPGLLRSDTLEQELAALRALEQERRGLREYLALLEGPGPDTAAYHQEVIADATEQFEEVETTLSHFFHLPHPALCGRRYGAALCDALLARRPLEPGGRVLEIGCGTGLLARHLLDRLRQVAPGVYRRLSYTLLDLSPALQAAQREQLCEHAAVVRFEQGDALRFEATAPFDLIISNEVIADLPVRRLDPFSSAGSDPEAAAQWDRYDLRAAGAPSRLLLNTGAIRLLERLPALLAPTGLAALSEYGAPDAPAVARPLGGHVEHSIHFGHLEAVARALDLVPQLQTTTDLLGFDRTVEIVDVVSLDLIRKALCPRLGLAPLPRVAFTREMLAAALGEVWPHLHNVSFHPVGSYPYDLIPDRYLYLTLRHAR